MGGRIAVRFRRLCLFTLIVVCVGWFAAGAVGAFTTAPTRIERQIHLEIPSTLMSVALEMNGPGEDDDVIRFPNEGEAPAALTPMTVQLQFSDGSPSPGLEIFLVNPGGSVTFWDDANEATGNRFVDGKVTFAPGDIMKTIYLKPESVSGTFNDVTVEAHAYYPVGPPVATEDLTVLKIDLDADSDRTGTVDRSPEEESGEEPTDTARPAIIMVNNDFDSGSQDRLHPDYANSVVDIGSDAHDLSRLHVEVRPALPSGWKARLIVSPEDAGRLNIFPALLAGTTAVIGGAQVEHFPATPIDATFGIEATKYLDVGFQGRVEVALQVSSPTGSLESLSPDKVAFEVAPVLFTPSTQEPENFFVYTCDFDLGTGPKLRAYVDGLKTLLPGRVFLEAKCPQSGSASTWSQDNGELGYMSRPGSDVRPVLLDLMPNSGHLDDVTVIRNYGYLSLQGEAFGNGGQGGNVEIMPDGQIVVGSNIEAGLKTFLEAQRRQQPMLELNVAWLEIGHVDEVVSFISPSIALVPDTTLAYNLLAEHDKFEPGQGILEEGASDRLTSTEPGKVWDPAMWSNGFVSLVDSNGNVLERRQVKGVAAEGNSLLVSRPWSVAPGTYSYILRNRSAYNCLFVEDEYDAGVVEDAYNSEGRGSLVDSAKQWTPNAFAGSSVWVAEGPGEGATSRKILSNTENALVLEELWVAMPERTSVYVIAKEFKSANDDKAPRTVHAVMQHQPLRSYNDNRQVILDGIPGELGAGFSVVRVPAIYEPYHWVAGPHLSIPSRSYLPNLVNLLQDGGKLVMPKTFCKVGGRDIFEDYIRANLVGYEPKFIDSWLWHEQGGEVHCSTNA